MSAKAELLRVGDGLREQVEVCNRSEVDATAEDVADDGRIRRGRLRDQHIAQMHVGMHAAAGADAEQLLAAVLVDELVDVDRDGRDAHASALHGDRDAFVRARVAEDIADMRVLLGAVEEVLSDVLGAQRVAWQQDAFGDLAFFSSDMRGAHEMTPSF